jgi:NIMA (never in mitosis gene a)-related kinase
VECPDKSMAVVKTIYLENMNEEEKKESYLEGKILEKLDHPNIIKFREVYLTKKPKLTLCIVMDFADGGDLQSRIKAQKTKLFNENQILDWFTQICLAIKHIHDRKILHRDIKSQNIFLTKNGLVKLGDFGIAKCLNATLDKAKTIVGTPYYLSPEIVQNKPYSFKSDIWSLGILLYEMCALKMPFDASSLPMLSLKIIRGQYNPLPATLSKDLRNLVQIMLSVDTNKRLSINEVMSIY